MRVYILNYLNVAFNYFMQTNKVDSSCIRG